MSVRLRQAARSAVARLGLATPEVLRRELLLWGFLWLSEGAIGSECLPRHDCSI